MNSNTVFDLLTDCFMLFVLGLLGRKFRLAATFVWLQTGETSASVPKGSVYLPWRRCNVLWQVEVSSWIGRSKIRNYTDTADADCFSQKIRAGAYCHNQHCGFTTIHIQRKQFHATNLARSITWNQYRWHCDTGYWSKSAASHNWGIPIIWTAAAVSSGTLEHHSCNADLLLPNPGHLIQADSQIRSRFKPYYQSAEWLSDRDWALLHFCTELSPHSASREDECFRYTSEQ